MEEKANEVFNLEYEKAEARVWFKGFEIKRFSNGDFDIYVDSTIIYSHEYGFLFESIQDLKGVELTKEGKKQAGL